MNRIDKQIQLEVVKLLSWTVEQHNQFIYDCGIAYLTEIAPKYPQVVTQIAKTKSFWNWWNAHWELREKEFIETIDESPEAIIDVVQLHKDLHDPKVLAAAKYLNGLVLEESYVNLIATITKEQHASTEGEAKVEATALAGVSR